MCHKKILQQKKIATKERQKQNETECILCLQGFLGFLFHQRAYIFSEKLIPGWKITSNHGMEKLKFWTLYY